MSGPQNAHYSFTAAQISARFARRVSIEVEHVLRRL